MPDLEPFTIRMNRTESGRRLPETRETTFVQANLTDHDTYDWIYELLDSTGALWRASVTMFEGVLWLLIDEQGTRYWAEQPYPNAAAFGLES